MRPVDGLADAAASEDQGRTLRALRDRLAAQIDACDSARDVAALSARLVDVLEAIAKVPAAKEGTALDELASRRAGAGVTARQARTRRG